MKYYIGVDGGGTKTLYALFDENKNCIATVKTGGCNHENLEGSYTQAAEVIMGGISQLLSENGKTQSDISGILMGIAGMDHPFQYEILNGLLVERGLRNFKIYNDGYIVTKAGSPDGTGIGYNCGTGTCCNSISPDGKLLQVGGLGELSGDVGGGHWIAQQVYIKVYDDICLKRAETSMTKALFEKFSLSPAREEFLSLVPRVEEFDADTVHDLIDVFFDALNCGDAGAMEICEVMATRGADFIAAHTKLQKFEGDSINVVLSGSIHVKLPSQVYIEKLKKYAVEKSGKNLNFIMLNAAPVTGCINWLLEKN